MQDSKELLSNARINTPPYFINGIHRITVSVIGCGGNGSLILTKLARLDRGLKHIDHPGLHVTVVDFDVVEQKNVGRQSFVDADISEYKSVAMVSKVNHAFGLDWDAAVGSYQDKRSASLGKNIVIVCVDDNKTRLEVLKDFYGINYRSGSTMDTDTGFFLIDCGNGKDYGQVILMDKFGHLPNYFDIYGMELPESPEGEDEVSCSYWDDLEKQGLFINDHIASYVGSMLENLLFYKKLEYSAVFFSIKEGNTRFMEVKEPLDARPETVLLDG